MRRADPGSARQARPWEAAGVSRATFYRHLARERETITPPADETGKHETGKALPPETEAVRQQQHETIPRETRTLPLLTSCSGADRCCQCNGERDGQEAERVIGGNRVLLHAECARFYVLERDPRHGARFRWPWFPGDIAALPGNAVRFRGAK